MYLLILLVPGVEMGAGEAATGIRHLPVKGFVFQQATKGYVFDPATKGFIFNPPTKGKVD